MIAGYDACMPESSALANGLTPVLPLAPQDAVIIAAALATCGWLYAARKARALSRKQHTINIIMQGESSNEFRDAEACVSPHLRSTDSVVIDEMHGADKAAFRMVLNRYEFIATGIRNGDLDERLVKDALRGTILSLYEICEAAIYKQRDNRRRQALYEHLEWLHSRWRAKPVWWSDVLEWMIDRPLPSRRVPPDT